MKTQRRLKLFLLTSTLRCGAVILAIPGLAAGQAGPARPEIRGPIVVQPVKPDVFFGRVQDLPKAMPNTLEGIEVDPRIGTPSNPPVAPTIDPAWQRTGAARDLGLLSDPILNIDGATIGSGAIPHDPIGDAGLNNYVQMINIVFAIYDKAGHLLAGPSPINSLWTSQGISGTPCSDLNLGDGIIRFDRFAQRWLLSQFATPSYLCMAVSVTEDPTGPYYLYQFDVGQVPDYFKIGVWLDGYYVSANFETQTLVAVFDRVEMLNGNPAGQVQFVLAGLPNLDFNIFMPSDVDGRNPPPFGSPDFFYRQHDITRGGGGPDRIELWEFHVDWSDPQKNSTFTGPTDIQLHDFKSTLCGFLSFSCVPQPPSTADPTPPMLDPVNEPPMWRFQYRNFGNYETLVGNFTVDVTGFNSAGIRWFELRRPLGGAWTRYQDGTYAPQPINPLPAPPFTDFVHRWVGSIAMDRFGNIALGFNVSNAIDIFPSIRYTGRVGTDPLGLLLQPEKTIIAGGNNTDVRRWGEYSSLTIDPSDDCTFWYTNDYITDAGLRQTRIANFRFSQCQADH